MAAIRGAFRCNEINWDRTSLFLAPFLFFRVLLIHYEFIVTVVEISCSLSLVFVFVKTFPVNTGF